MLISYTLCVILRFLQVDLPEGRLLKTCVLRLQDDTEERSIFWEGVVSATVTTKII